MKMKERGSALVSVILVLLVLTIVGVGIAYFTSMEDRLSGNTRISKAGFYAADAGLRRGEVLLNRVINLDPIACGPQDLSQLLAARSAAPADVLKVPGGGYDAKVLDLATLPAPTVACLGGLLGDARLYKNISIPKPTTVSVVDLVTYSLYLRNNVDDAKGADIVDKDNIVNLVSVGTVALPTGVLVTKIVEEQLLLTKCGATKGNQKEQNEGGTSTSGTQDC